jgi:hypothetical protein
MQLKQELARQIPRGTPQQEVDKILKAEIGSTPEFDKDRPNIATYFYSKEHATIFPENDGEHSVRVMYDVDRKVHQLWATGSSVPILTETPPNNRNDPGVFRFEDYQSSSDLITTFKTIFPLGTPESTLDNVLIKWAGASKFSNTNNTHQAIYSYSAKQKAVHNSLLIGWTLRASFNETRQLAQLHLSSGPVVSAFKHDTNYFFEQKQ